MEFLLGTSLTTVPTDTLLWSATTFAASAFATLPIAALPFAALPFAALPFGPLLPASLPFASSLSVVG